MADTFFYTTPEHALAQPMVQALLADYDQRYGNYFDEAGAKAELYRYPASEFAPPYGNFLLLLRDGQAIGSGAFRQHSAGTAELKRMWTRDDLRRQGLAGKVLLELASQATRQGYQRLYITTGFRQPEAVGLYLHYGYTPLFDLHADPELYGTLPFEKYLGGKHLNEKQWAERPLIEKPLVAQQATGVTAAKPAA